MTRPDRWAWPARGLLWVDIAWGIFAVHVENFDCAIVAGIITVPIDFTKSLIECDAGRFFR